jgi:nitroreductase
MELLELMKYRRSIRKYEERQVEIEKINKIVEAGSYAPNAGGGQRSVIVTVRNKELLEQLGRANVGGMDRSRLIGNYVSKEQPSIIDDPTIKSGFYGAPTVCAIFTPKRFLYGEADAFCVAENMVLEATELGVASCMIARGEETFASEWGQNLLREWEIPEGYIARCFILLGYCKGEYPQSKPRKAGRCKVIE